MVYEFAPWIQEVEHDIRVELVTGREHDHLIVFIRLLQALDRVRSHVYARLYHFPVRKGHVQHCVRHFLFQIVNAMDQSLVQIEDQSLLLDNGMSRLWQIHSLLIDFLVGGLLHLLDVLQTLQCLQQVQLVQVGSAAPVHRALVDHCRVVVRLRGVALLVHREVQFLICGVRERRLIGHVCRLVAPRVHPAVEHVLRLVHYDALRHVLFHLGDQLVQLRVALVLVLPRLARQLVHLDQLALVQHRRVPVLVEERGRLLVPARVVHVRCPRPVLLHEVRVLVVFLLVQGLVYHVVRLLVVVLEQLVVLTLSVLARDALERSQ